MFTSKEKKIIDKVLELENVYPENTRLTCGIIYYLVEINNGYYLRDYARGICNDLYGNINICRKKTDNKKLEALRDMLIEKFGFEYPGL